MQDEKKALPAALRLLPMLLMMALIFWLSHQPASQIELPNFFLADKFGHAILYGLLALTVVFVPLPEWRSRAPGTIALFGLAVSILYGVGDEFHQSFIPGRDPSVGDIIADGCGAAVVAVFWWRRHRQ